MEPAAILSNEELSNLPKLPKQALLPSMPGKSVQYVKDYENKRIEKWIAILKDYNK